MEPITIIIVWVIYVVLLLLALIYSGIVVYHVLKYRFDDDLPREQGYYAGLALAVYLSLSGLILLTSIMIAMYLLIFSSA